MPKTYTLPLLSVRIVQPSSGWICPLLAAAVTCFCVHVLPPSVEVATISGAGTPCPSSWSPNEAPQTSPLPNNRLARAECRHICDLTLNAGDYRLQAFTAL